MVIINFYPNGFVIKGHASYADKGNDIVCSGISAISLGSINWFKKSDIIQFINDESIPQLVLKLKINQTTKLGLSLIKTQLQTITNTYKQHTKLITNKTNLK